MKILYKRFSVVLGFAMLLILLIANGVVIERQLSVQVENQTWVLHTQQVLFEVSQTKSLITDAETGQRGFLYTGDAQYLADYQRAAIAITPHIDRLADLTRDNPRQEARVGKLRILTQAKMGELSQTIALYKAGQPDDAKTLVQSDEGLTLMNDIRQLAGEMEQEESLLAANRVAMYRHSVRVTTGCIYLASALAGAGLILLAYFILREMRLREQHARQMEEREEWFRATLTSLGDAVIATDAQGRVTFLNPIAEQLMGMDAASALGRRIEDVFPIFNESTHEPVENPVQKVVEQGRTVGLANHTVLKRTDGTLIPIEDSAAPIRDGSNQLVGVVLVFRDATHERKAQELLRKSEKLAAAARLSATVAHEINNPLESVGNLVYLAKGAPGLPPEAYEHLAQVEVELERVAHITRQTLGFYRESKVPDEIEIAALVESVLKIYANKFRAKSIRIEREFGECPPLRGLAGELKQVVSNLISNAADAVDENGTIRVRLACVDAHGGKAVQVSIEDDGPGITEEHRTRIFEPFFTTKKDVGTGLGLWVTKEIVDRHGGDIEVHSRVDKGASGTAFHVVLPVAPEMKSSAMVN